MSSVFFAKRTKTEEKHVKRTGLNSGILTKFVREGYLSSKNSRDRVSSTTMSEIRIRDFTDFILDKGITKIQLVNTTEVGLVSYKLFFLSHACFLSNR